MNTQSPNSPLSDDTDDENTTEYTRREIPMSDLPTVPDDAGVHSPELSDLNTPGEIDIEDLDEDAVSDALPPDARLDPLEE